MKRKECVVKNTRMVILALVALCASLSLVGCAASARDQQMQSILPEIDVVQVKENSDEALKMAQQAKLDIEVLNNKLTEIDNKLMLLSEQVSEVSIAKIEEIETRMSLLIEAYKDLQAQVNNLQTTGGIRSSQGGAAGTPRGATFSPSSASGILKTSTEYESYQNALRTFNSRKYDQALKMLTENLNTYPNGSYADNTQYWIGESHYAQGDYAGAVNAFKKVFAYSNTAKADDAQLKIGLCHLKMGQYADAKSELKLLIDRYPASEYVTRAQKYLTEMK